MTVRTQPYPIAGRTREDLIAAIEDAVERGDLAAGAALPSVRALAADAGVSPATVAAAYRDLRGRGVVTSQPRRGVRVAHRPPLASARIDTRVPVGIVDLATGNPDPALLPPLPTLAPPARPQLYGDPPHLPELRTMFRAELTDDGVPADHLTLASGALDGIDRVLDVHLRPGDRIAVEDPCWTGTRDLVRLRGLEAVGVAVDASGLRIDALERVLASGVDALLFTPRAHNPTGAATDATRAGMIRRLIAHHPDVLVIEDDHAGAVAGTPHHPVAVGQRRWAVVRSVAKSLGPDLRLAAVAGDRHTVSRVEGRFRLGPGWISTVLQRLVAQMLRDPATAGRLAAAADTYGRRRDAVVAALAGVGIAATGRSGFNVWVPVPEEAPVVTGLQHAGWAVRAGEAFRLDAGPAIRISTAALAEDDAPALAAALGDLLGAGEGTRVA
jgi:DNA-binding transcriptional MocR family regulator